MWLNYGIGRAEEPKKTPDSLKTKITIGKETTYITEPLDADGYPDYFAALNRRMSEGVTPDNNAAVPLIKALGPREIPKDARTEYFKLLGIDPLPAEGKYVVPFEEMIERKFDRASDTFSQERDKLFDQLSYAVSRPWKPQEFWLVAEWFKVNEQPLKLAVEATEKKKCFFPAVRSGKEPMLFMATLREEWKHVDEIVACLAARAMLEVQQGKLEAAWHDVMCCYRLTELLDQGPFASENSRAWMINTRYSDQAAIAVAHFGNPSPAQARKMAAEFDQLKGFSNPLDKCDIGERFVLLDEAVAVTARATRPKSIGQAMIRAATGPAFDADLVLKLDNQWFDACLAAARMPDREQRKAAHQKVEDELKKIRAETSMQDLTTKWLSKEVISRRVAAEIEGNRYQTAFDAPYVYYHSTMDRRLTRTCLALAAYRADTRHYPEKLSDLVSKYMSAIPEDIWANPRKPIRYRREGKAYAVWSFVSSALQDNDDPDDAKILRRPVPKEEPPVK